MVHQVNKGIMDQNTNELFEKLFNQLSKRFEPYIQVMTQLNLANEFYSKDQRGILYVQYESLVNLSHDAYVEMTEHTKQASIDYRTTDMYRVEHDHLRAKKVDADKLIDEFREKHRLIVHLINAKAKFSKFPHEE